MAVSMRNDRIGRTGKTSMATRLAGSVLAAALLAACVGETTPDVTARMDEAPVSQPIAPRPGVSPAGATLAFVSLAGAPDAIRQRMGAAMTSAIATRQIKLAAQSEANYLVQGHLIAVPQAKTTVFAWKWDVFGADRTRRARIEDGLTVQGTSADPWSLLSEQAATEIANRSARELAAFLTHTPEAIAAAKQGGAPTTSQPVPAAGAAVAAASAPAPALGYSPLPATGR